MMPMLTLSQTAFLASIQICVCLRAMFMMISMMMTAAVVCGIAVDLVFPLLFVHVDAVACGAIAHHALDAPRDICDVMFISCVRRLVMSCFVSLAGSGQTAFGGSSSDNSVRIWDVSTQQQVAVLTGHTSEVNAVAFDVSGKYLASGDVMMMIK